MKLPNIVCKLCGSEELVLVGIENFRCSACGSDALCSTRAHGRAPIIYRPKTLGVPGA
jgi:hypothetical protein